MKVFAMTVSILLHPLLLPLYLLVITFNTGTLFSYIPESTQYMSYLLTLLGMTLVPLLSMPLLKWMGLIDDYLLSNKQDRVFPVLVTIIGAFLVFYLSRDLPYVEIVRRIYLIAVILLSGFMIVTMRWKMSMHMTAIGGLCGFVFIFGMRYFGDVMTLLPILILLSGILAFSRLYLKRHTPAQVYAGYLYGALAVVGILLYR